jgi:uncharacterized membrane protein
MDGCQENPNAAETLPWDLLAVAALAAIAAAVALVPTPATAVLRVPLGILFALFLPGYALVAALFPQGANGDTGDTTRERWTLQWRIDWLERLSLSVPASAAEVVLVTGAVARSPYRFRLAPVVLALACVTVATTLVGVLRWYLRPPTERYRTPVPTAGRRAVDAFGPSQSNFTPALVLALAVVLAAGSVGYALTNDEVESTEFYLLGEADGGRLVSDEYPTEFDRNESRTVVIGIGNHEGSATTYTVVTVLQRVREVNDGVDVVQERELSRTSTTVSAGDTRLIEQRVRPAMGGHRLRLTYLLYADTPPDNPTTETAYREVHLFINVTTPAVETRSRVPPSAPHRVEVDFDAARSRTPILNRAGR